MARWCTVWHLDNRYSYKQAVREGSSDDDEVQVIDTSTLELNKEEGEKIIAPAQGESSENPQEKTNLEASQDNPSLASLATTYVEDSK